MISGQKLPAMSTDQQCCVLLIGQVTMCVFNYECLCTIFKLAASIIIFTLCVLCDSVALL